MKLNTVTMRQSLSCYRISTCLPCSHHLHSFQFILLSIFYIFFFVCEKVHGPFFNFVSLEAASTGEIFQKGLLVYFYASFFFSEAQNRRSQQKSFKLFCFPLLESVFWVSWKMSKLLLGSFHFFCGIGCLLLMALIAFSLQRVSTMKVWCFFLLLVFSSFQLCFGFGFSERLLLLLGCYQWPL